MKTLLKSIIIILIFASSEHKICGQYYYDYNWNYSLNTYNQNAVTIGLYTAGDDWNWWERWQIKNECLNTYNGVEYIGEACKEYNCHFYAWFKSEQYPSDKYWMNYPEENWLDYSFVRVSYEQYPGKVTYSYSNGTLDHSAKTTSTAGRYISKWGPLCLMEHDYDECPYWVEGAQNREYYERFIVSGPNEIVCSNVYYDVPNTYGQGYSVTWSTNDKLSINNQNNYCAEVYPVSSGEGIVTANIYKSGYAPTHSENKTVSTNVDLPYPPTGMFNEGLLCVNSPQIFFVLIDNINENIINYDWEVSGEGALTSGQGTRIISIESYGPGYLTVAVRAENLCGYSDYYSEDFYIDYCDYGMFSLYPNPASDYVEVSISSPEIPIPSPSKNAEVTQYTVRIINNIGIPVFSAKKSEKSFTIPISSLKKGTYTVEIDNGKKIVTKQLIINH